MRLYMIALWILLILSIFHVTLAVPMAVREMLEARSNAVVVVKDTAAWEKRMDPNHDDGSPIEGDDQPDPSQSEADRVHSDDPPHSNLKSMSDVESESEHEHESESEFESGSESGSDGSHGSDNDNGDVGVEGGGEDYAGFDAAADNYYYGDGRPQDVDGGEGNDNDPYDGDNDNTEHSTPSDSEHPATPEHMSFFENIFKGPLEFRPRNSGSGAVGMPKKDLHREWQGTVGTKAYVSDSSLGAVTSVRDPPVHNPNRKKRIPDWLV